MRLLQVCYWLLLAVLLNAAALLHAQDGEFVVGEFTLLVPWAAQTPAAPDSMMAFLIAQNPLTIDDELISFASSIAEEHVIIPASTYKPEDGTPTISVPIGQTVFRPGNGFLQFKTLKTALPPGSKFTATLTFYRVGPREVIFDVVSAQDAAVRLGVINPNQPQNPAPADGSAVSSPATSQTPDTPPTTNQPAASSSATQPSNARGGFSRADLFFSDQK